MMKEDTSVNAGESAPRQAQGTSLPRLTILGSLMVVLFFPALAFYLIATRKSLDSSFAVLAIALWMGSAAVLLILCGKQARTEPDLVQGCLRAMALAILLLILMTLGFS